MTEIHKVFFLQDIDGNLYETETLWCVKDGDNFIVDNIPFIARRISLGDTIKAEYDKDENAYYFEDFVAVSGNSTIRIFFYDETIIQDIREQLKVFGCESEGFLKRKMISVNVPREIDYKPVKAYLDNGEENELWTYEESCLAHEY